MWALIKIIIMVKIWLAKTNAGKFSQEITNNGENVAG